MTKKNSVRKNSQKKKKNNYTTHPACISSFVKLPAPSPNSCRYIQSWNIKIANISKNTNVTTNYTEELNGSHHHPTCTFTNLSVHLHNMH